MDLFSSFFVVAAPASADDANASTGDSPDVAQADAPRNLAEARETLAGPRRDALAFLISALTSPFLVCAVAAGALAATLADSWREVLIWGAMGAIFAGVVPFAIVLVFFLRGKITDMHVAVKEQRWVPLGASMLSGTLGLIALGIAGAPLPLLALTAGYLANAVAFAAISVFWKASIHAGVYCGAFAACALVVSPWWWMGLLGLPAVIWARSRRGRHTVPQGVVGAGIAVALVCGTYYAVMSIWGS